ncbi:threonylcarbamoyl-AMP synthase [Candidatus Woesearchaeota archaeon]|nr:threonylcarbamoyl-AMP synthase [Candidatus Woesearchaeota archaeon]|tara:strand:+ start:1922 stop:2494 length:573 start_codon:yes stop_codon:yes gene_type:complete
MNIVTKKEFLDNKSSYIKKIKVGAVFIYPTDTIYGLGCNATNSKAVKRIRKIKQRDTAPFSVAVPSKKWIKDNCIVSKEAEKWLKKLPGPYTLLLKLKSKKAVATAVNPKTDILGVRIPNNWFSKIVKEANIPIVSTSANITKKQHMTSLKDLNKTVAKQVDFIIYEGKKQGKPSEIVMLYEKKVKVIQR